MVNNLNLNNIAVIGDSYSTYKGYVPQDYRCYYGAGRTDVCDIPSVEHSWWYNLALKTNSKIVKNSSFSGSTISRINYGGIYNEYQAFTSRIQRDFDFDEINTFIIYGGTNDSWASSPLGQNKFENFTEEDFSLTLPSFCFLLYYIKQKNPKIRIISLINFTIKENIKREMIGACNYFKVEYVELKEFSVKNGHPDTLGMEQITSQIIENLSK